MTSLREFDYNPPSGLPLIIFEDGDLLAVDKPAGLLSVPGKADEHKDCLETRLRGYCPDVLLIHRLDMATSGVMIFAKNKAAQRHIGLQFEKRMTRKIYRACIAGTPPGTSGHINQPIITDWPNRPMQKIDFEMGRPAQTDWTAIKTSTSHTDVDLYPVTGRSHQLRLHMKIIGHPILGDRLYAPDAIFGASERLCLHACSLSLRHPTGGAWHDFTSPCPF